MHMKALGIQVGFFFLLPHELELSESYGTG